MNNDNYGITKDKERMAVIEKIGDTLKANNLEGKLYFTKAEIAHYKAYIKPTTSIEELKIRANDLQKELKKRQATFVNIITPKTKQQEMLLY